MHCHPFNIFLIKVLTGCIFLFCATPCNWDIWRRRALSAQDIRYLFSSKIKIIQRDEVPLDIKMRSQSCDFLSSWRSHLNLICRSFCKPLNWVAWVICTCFYFTIYSSRVCFLEEKLLFANPIWETSPLFAQKWNISNGSNGLHKRHQNRFWNLT